MNYQLDRRNTDRFNISGAQILYKPENGEAALKPMKDLTLSGVCFQVDEKMPAGYFLELRVIIHGNESIMLKGNVVWSKFMEAEGIIFTAVQFLPFGTDERYNSMENYQKLKKLVGVYQSLSKTA